MTCITVYHTPKVRVTFKCRGCKKNVTRVVGRHLEKKVKFCNDRCQKKFNNEIHNEKMRRRRNGKE